MHETLSPHIKGYIDQMTLNVETSTRCYQHVLKGWLGTVDREPIRYEDLQIEIKGHPLSKHQYDLSITNRPDVISFYQQYNIVIHVVGFEWTCRDQLFLENDDRIELKVKDQCVFQWGSRIDEEFDLNRLMTRNVNTKPAIIIVDDFYENPDLIRKYALQQVYQENKQYHKGARTAGKFTPPWIGEEFGRLLQKPVREFVGATGVFQYCTAQDALVYHYDTQEYAAIVYLTPNAPLQTGTQTYRSIHTGLMCCPTEEEAKQRGSTVSELLSKSFGEYNFYDRHNMELVDSVANVYNRLIIFNAQLFHAATSYFGSNKENGRLFHLFFFNCE